VANIKSGASSDLWTIDPVSKAGRVSLYDSLGNFRGTKATYRAANSAALAAAAGTGLFFVISGSATKTLNVQRIVISGLTLTAVAYSIVLCQKYSTAPTGGTPVVFTQVPLDSTSAAGTAGLVQGYTAAPTAGTLVGPIGSRRSLMQATTAAAAGSTVEIVWDFRGQGETAAGTLRGTAEAIALNFSAAPASAVTMSVEVEWTEE
jgi:hypothetical protein